MGLKLVEATPTLDTSAYADGDRMGTLMTLSGVEAIGGAGPTKLLNLAILDKAAQKAALDVLIFNASPTIASADNAALSITDTECEKLLAHVVVAAADYRDIGSGAALACVRGINFALKPTADGKLYALAVSRGSPTYAATSLIFKFTFEF